jgi:hypothetical protein
MMIRSSDSDRVVDKFDSKLLVSPSSSHHACVYLQGVYHLLSLEVSQLNSHWLHTRHTWGDLGGNHTYAETRITDPQ